MHRAPVMPLDPEVTYVHLATDGTSQVAPGGAGFWSMPTAAMARFDEGWLISEFTCDKDWASWEMHPNGDEFVYLLSGDVELHLELPSGVSSTRIAGRGAVLVPRGIWHTATVFRPSRMFFVTRGGGTQHRQLSGV